MEFYTRRKFTSACEAKLSQYDREVAALTGPHYPYPLRMRDWELCRILEGLSGASRDSRILDTGSFNTYLGLYLSQSHPGVVVSDLLRRRYWKSVMRRAGLAPRKPTEAPYFAWKAVMRRAGIPVKSLDLTQMECADRSFDHIVALSVIEHIPGPERALAEMYRVLSPGGKILLTTDCTPAPKPFSDGVRYFSKPELERLFSPYPVTSPRDHPDFAPENWCYGGKQPIVTLFVEITKPA